MKTMTRGAMAALMLAAAPVAVMAEAGMAEAEKMMERAQAMRAEADALAKKAQAMMDEASKRAEASGGSEGNTAHPAVQQKDEEVENADAGKDDKGGAASAKATAAKGEKSSEGSDDPNIKVSYEEDGKFFTEDDIPTYSIAADGTIDWYTFSGFRRYHAECHVCHGPDGEGSTYAPALKDSAINMDYYDFVDVIVNGRKHVGASENSVMPAFGTNKNVMCYLDDIYVYLKARGTDAVARGRPPKKARKSDAYVENEDACMG